MKDLIEYIAKSIVDSPEEVVVIEEPAEDGIVLRLQVAPDDTGKVIGKEGRIAKAMRTLLRVAAIRKGTRASLEIVSDPEPPRSGYGAGSETGPSGESDSDSDSGPSSEPDSDRGFGPSSEPDSDSDSGPSSDSDSDSDSSPSGESGSDSDSGSSSDSDSDRSY